MPIKTHKNGSWEGSTGGAIPNFSVALQAPSAGAVLVDTAVFIGNPLRISDSAPTNEYNTYLTGVEFWRGTAASPISKVGDCFLGGYGWQYNYDSNLLADGFYDFHFKFILTDASTKKTPEVNVQIDNVQASPPVQGDVHTLVRNRVYLATNVDTAAKEAAWGDGITGRKKFAGGRTWSQWLTNVKSLVDEASPSSTEKVVCPTGGPQNETVISSITSGANPVITLAQAAPDISTGDTVVLLYTKKTGGALSALSSSGANRKPFVVTKISTTQFRLDGQSFEGGYPGGGELRWGGSSQIEWAAGTHDDKIRQIRDYILAKLAAYTSGQRAAWFARMLWNPWHELNGNWYAHSNMNDRTYDGRTGAWVATRNAWRRWYRIIMYEESGYSGAVPTSARTGSMAQLYGARCMKWGYEVSTYDVQLASAFEPWPGDEYVDVVAMNMYPFANGGESVNVWDGTNKQLAGTVANSAIRRGAELGLWASNVNGTKGDCQKMCLDWLAAWARNTNNVRRAYGGGVGDTRVLQVGVGEWSPVALKTKDGKSLTYVSDAVPIQEIQGLYDWSVANVDILQRIAIFDVDKDEGYFAVILPLPGWTPRSPATSHGLAADGTYKAHNGIGTARATVANKASHRPSVSNKLLDVWGRKA